MSKPDKSKTKWLSARVPYDLYKRVRLYAFLSDTDTQTVVIEAVTDYLDRMEKHVRPKQ